MIPNAEVKVTPLFDVECLTNGKTYNKDTVYREYTRPTQGCHCNNLEWLSKIFNDTKRRAVSLWQLNSLSRNVTIKLRNPATYTQATVNNISLSDRGAAREKVTQNYTNTDRLLATVDRTLSSWNCINFVVAHHSSHHRLLAGCSCGGQSVYKL